MNDNIKKGKLGMGLETLLGMQNFNAQKSQTGIDVLNLDLIVPNDNQPRKDFDTEGIMNLAESIKQNGVLQPIIICQIEGNKFMIIAGERRFRAAKLAGLSEIPVVIKDASEEKMAMMSIIENIQRSDLGVLEEADAYLALKEKFNLTQNEIAHRLSKNRSHIANMLRIASSGDKVKNFVRENGISYGILKLVCGRDDIFEILQLTVDNCLSVRGLENYLKTGELPELGEESKSKVKIEAKNIEKPSREFLQKISQTQSLIRGRSGLAINLKFDAKAEDGIKISIKSEEQLDEVLKIFGS